MKDTYLIILSVFIVGVTVLVEYYQPDIRDMHRVTMMEAKR